MGIFFEKPTKGPDVVGGVWPIADRGRCWNRSGATLTRGEVVQLAFQPGEATEIATNDENSYIPGASNDTIWNTVIDPISSTAVGSSIQRGGIFGVVLDEGPIADNASVWVQFFGIVEAFCASSGTVQPGDPLVPTITNSLFNPCPTSNSIIATYIDQSDTSLTARELHRVFLHQGLFAPHRSPAALS